MKTIEDRPLELVETSERVENKRMCDQQKKCDALSRVYENIFKVVAAPVRGAKRRKAYHTEMEMSVKR